jgi:molecular chaperone HscB
MVQCPSCARLQEPRIICSGCAAPLTADLDCFAALGLPRKLQIDIETLERRYHELGRHLHPDRFAAASAKVRDLSLRTTALLTRSYRTLRDRVSRGRYWLELNGHKLSENNKQVPVDLAELVFEAQEELADLRRSAERGESESMPARDEVLKRQTEIGNMLKSLTEELEENFTRFDTSAHPWSHALFMELKDTLSKIAYMTTLMRDIEKALDTKAAA